MNNYIFQRQHKNTNIPMGIKLLLVALSSLTVFSLLKQAFLPNLELSIVLGFVVAFDLITGVIKSFSLDPDSINSTHAKDKGITISWYFVIIIGSGFCNYMATYKGLFIQESAKILTDGVLCYLIWSEVLSISENGINTRGLPKTLYIIFKAIHKGVSLQFMKGWFLKSLSDKYDNDSENKN